MFNKFIDRCINSNCYSDDWKIRPLSPYESKSFAIKKSIESIRWNLRNCTKLVAHRGAFLKPLLKTMLQVLQRIWAAFCYCLDVRSSLPNFLFKASKATQLGLFKNGELDHLLPDYTEKLTQIWQSSMMRRPPFLNRPENSYYLGINNALCILDTTSKNRKIRGYVIPSVCTHTELLTSFQSGEIILALKSTITSRNKAKRFMIYAKTNWCHTQVDNPIWNVKIAKSGLRIQVFEFPKRIRQYVPSGYTLVHRYITE